MVHNQELTLLRIVAQRLAGPRWQTPSAAVRHLGAVQAQDLTGALTSVALRVQGGSSEEVRAALDRGELVRTWPMRGTLHLVPAEDVGWMMAITGDRIESGLRTRLTESGIDDAALAKAAAVAAEVLADGQVLTRAALMEHWVAAGLPAQRRTALFVLHVLCGAGQLALGPMVGTEQQVVHLPDWVPNARSLDAEEGLTEWVRRYALSHGPVTERDAARWLGLPLGRVRPALARADGLERLDIDGVRHYLDPAVPDLLAEHRRDARRLLLLPGFDELMLGYGDRTFAVPPAHLHRLVPGGNGVFRATVVKAGRVIGLWRRAGTPARPTIDPDPFTAWGPRTRAGVQLAFERLP
ncbi:winged helix DNA-binding domain-containing protein [Ruania albidiflava]|uniref:winged helix DNA-binding domain-containing protein n=1 Tax=Ruania albidiflava TaxID=366586 RepID=UPI0023F07613|nr:winged helix DNA-binding domain-containing protein [Ruania albidiflava]